MDNLARVARQEGQEMSQPGTGASTPVSSTGSTASFRENQELLADLKLDTHKRTASPSSDEDGKVGDDNGSTIVGTSTRGVPHKKERVTAYVWFLTAMISISGLLFGLDTGIISGMLVSIRDDLGHTLTSSDKELITSMTTGFAFVGGIAAGVVSDKIGRKWLLAVADVTFVLGAVIQAVSHNIPTIAAGRGIIGLGVGMASCVCPLLISELAPTHMRGRLVTVNVVAITGGQVLAYGIGAAFEKTSGGWRWMSGLCAIPAGIQLAALFFLPESPRQLIVKDRLGQAKRALAKIYPYESEEELDVKMNAIAGDAREQAHLLASQPAWIRFKHLLRNGPNRRALIVACALQLTQQWSGINTLLYYSATLFANIGFDNPTAVGLIVSGTNFIGTLVALKYIDIVGRRRIMCITLPGMVIGLILASISFHYLTISTGGILDPNADYPTSWNAMVIFSMVFYVFSYATGVGNVPWQQGELFPTAYRGIGTSLATGTNWSMNLILSSTFLSIIEGITAAGAFGLFAGFCFLSTIFVFFCYPETSGLDIEEVQIIFKNDFGVRASAALRAEKRAGYLSTV